VLGGLIVAGIAGFLMNELVYEPLRRRGAKSITYTISTLALLVFTTGVLIMVFGAAPKVLNFGTPTYTFHGAAITGMQIMIMVSASLLLLAYYALVRHTKFGKAMRAVADNEVVAKTVGIDTRRIRRYAFVLASVLGGAAGILHSLEFNLEPNMGILLAVKGFAGAVIGGVGVFVGAIIGSALIGGIEQVAVWFWGSGVRNGVTFVLLLLFLLIRPSGIFGSRRNT